MKKKHYVLLIVLLVLVIGLAYGSTFKLEKIEVTGNNLASAELVEEKIKEQLPLNNTLVLFLQNTFDPVEDIPFVAKYDVSYKSKNTVEVTVYEKGVAGCVEYMEKYIYFDKDGVVLETTDEKKDGVPMIRGLKVNEWAIGERLPDINKEKFKKILTITQLIEKYELSIDGISFSADREIVLTHGTIKIELGNGKNLELQMMNLGSILSGVEGKSGTLYMKEFSEENQTVSFKETAK